MMRDNPMTAATPAASITAPPTAKRSPVTRIVLLLLLVVVIGGLFLLVRSRSRAAASTAAAAASAAANRIVPVLTNRVVQRDVPVWLEGLGNVAAFYTVTVKSQVDGPIVDVRFKEGQQVKKGDVLVQIDPRPFTIQLQNAQAALTRDEANLKNARLNLDRYKTLSEQNLIPVQQMTDQQSMVDQLAGTVLADEAQINSARLNLDYAQIKSPIDGVTGVRLVDPGNFVQTSDTTGIVVVTQLDPIAVFFTLPQDDLASIQEGMAGGTLTVEARSRNGDDLLGQGTLSVIDNQINQATATLRLKAIFDNKKKLLWPNQFVKARLHIKTRKDAIVVPAAVVQHGPNGTFAYVVGNDSIANMSPVNVEAVQGELAIISKGLQPGQEVVVEGQAQIRPGSRVSTKPAPPPSASAAATETPAAPGAPGANP